MSHFLLRKLHKLLSDRQLRGGGLIRCGRKNVVSPCGDTTDILQGKPRLAAMFGGNQGFQTPPGLVAAFLANCAARERSLERTCRSRAEKSSYAT